MKTFEILSGKSGKFKMAAWFTSLLLYCKVEAQDLELFSNYTGVNIQKRIYTITKIIILQKFEFSRKFLFT
jgi:hypothetical protein